MSFDWKSIVGTVAPAIATALGGPLAGMATAAIAKAVGLGDGASQEDVIAAVQGMTPEQLASLKQAELDFKARMEELKIDLERIAMQDRDSARKREVNARDSWTPRILAIIAVALFGACGAWIFNSDMTNMDSAKAGLVGAVLGYASGQAKTVYEYYFGSSAGRDATSVPGITSK